MLILFAKSSAPCDNPLAQPIPGIFEMSPNSFPIAPIIPENAYMAPCAALITTALKVSLFFHA